MASARPGPAWSGLASPRPHLGLVSTRSVLRIWCRSGRGPKDGGQAGARPVLLYDYLLVTWDQRNGGRAPASGLRPPASGLRPHGQTSATPRSNLGYTSVTPSLGRGVPGMYPPGYIPPGYTHPLLATSRVHHWHRRRRCPTWPYRHGTPPRAGSGPGLGLTAPSMSGLVLGLVLGLVQYDIQTRNQG